jgi:predicted nucleic acid-binding protein
MKGFNLPLGSLCFIDTNIWLYAFIRTEGDKNKISRSIIEEYEVTLSTQIVNEMCVNLIKKVNFSEAKISKLIDSFYKRYTIEELTQEVLLAASDIRKKYQFSFWDSIVAASALGCEADFLISEDMQHGFIFENKLEILNPFIRSTN